MQHVTSGYRESTKLWAASAPPAPMMHACDASQKNTASLEYYNTYPLSSGDLLCTDALLMMMMGDRKKEGFQHLFCPNNNNNNCCTTPTSEGARGTVMNQRVGGGDTHKTHTDLPPPHTDVISGSLSQPDHSSFVHLPRFGMAPAVLIPWRAVDIFLCVTHFFYENENPKRRC